jgi:hypothetical protein
MVAPCVFNFVQCDDMDFGDPSAGSGSPQSQAMRQSRNLSTIGKPFVPASQNPFRIFSEGVVKIGELLEQ